MTENDTATDNNEIEELRDGVTIQQIASTQDTDDPVFRATSEHAEMHCIFPSTQAHDLLVYTVRSTEQGGMSDLMDTICIEFDCEYVRFSTPLSDRLSNNLHGFETVVETIPDGPMAGDRWECLDGYWDVDREQEPDR